MANHKSSKKRIRQTIAKRATNKWKNSRVRTEIKKLKVFIEQNQKEDALKQFPVVQSLLAKLGKKGSIKKANASRKTSRLANQLAKL